MDFIGSSDPYVSVILPNSPHSTLRSTDKLQNMEPETTINKEMKT